jgi:hypothetical protein
VLIVIGGQIAGQGGELSTNVVNGFNQLSNWLEQRPADQLAAQRPTTSQCSLARFFDLGEQDHGFLEGKRQHHRDLRS